MEKSKKIKGSAVTHEDGSFTFTPYVSLPPEERNLEQIKKTRYSSLWIGGKSVSARLVFSRKNVPPLNVWIEEVMRMYNDLVDYVNQEKDYDL